MKATVIILMVVPAMFFSACTERGLDYHKEEGRIIVTPDWSNYACPSSACYGFYKEDGTAVTGVVQAATVPADCFSTWLPVGNYRLLAYNNDVPGVDYTGLENIASAEVILASSAQPAEVYSWSADGIEVSLCDTVRLNPSPRRLVKRMVLHFRVSGLEEVEILHGELNGVYPSLRLLTAEPSTQSIATAPETKTEFSAALTRLSVRSAETVYIASAELRLFGLLSPKDGECYNCRLNMKLHGAAGSVYDTTLNMDGVLTEIINIHAGALPEEEPVEVNIGIKWVDSTLVAMVNGWTEGSGEGEV